MSFYNWREEGGIIFKFHSWTQILFVSNYQNDQGNHVGDRRWQKEDRPSTYLCHKPKSIRPIIDRVCRGVTFIVLQSKRVESGRDPTNCPKPVVIVNLLRWNKSRDWRVGIFRWDIGEFFTL